MESKKYNIIIDNDNDDINKIIYLNSSHESDPKRMNIFIYFIFK